MSILHHRAALITGASQGLGATIAEHFVKAGASVVLCARDAAKLDETGRALAPLLAAGQSVKTLAADVADTQQVNSLVAQALAWFPHLDILVNNAGVYGPIGPLESNDWDAWVQAVHINIMGTVYTCRALLPHLKRLGFGKIINLSGGGATNPMPGLSSYAVSKAAVVRFTETLAHECRAFSIDVNAIAPGLLATRLSDQLLAAGPDAVGEAFYVRMKEQLAKGGTPLTHGASLAVYLASSESNGISGRLISAIWDDWQHLHEQGDLKELYTLRRVVAEAKP